MNDVPKQVPIEELYYSRDKGRAKGMVVLVLMCILGSGVAAYIGKQAHKRGVRYTDDINKQHAEYSKAHQELEKLKARSSE